MRFRHLSPVFTSSLFCILLALSGCTEETTPSNTGTNTGGGGRVDAGMREVPTDTLPADDSGGGESGVDGSDAGAGDSVISGEDCTNGADDDGDTLIDCGDDDCLDHPTCQAAPAFETNCSDFIDEDLDGRLDCDDPDCSTDPVCDVVSPDAGGGVDEICDDGVDNDGDGLRDCYDGDCSTDPACSASVAEDCYNGADDDGDGAIDCDDADCAATCGGTGGGGDTDPICAMLCPISPEIALLMGCTCGGGGGVTGETDCGNGIDDDGNGFADCEDLFSSCCDDAACASSPSCP